MTVVSFSGRPVLGSESITVSSSPIGLTAGKIRLKAEVNGGGGATLSANSALITVETNSIRVNLDRAVTVTTTDHGHTFAAASSFGLDGTEQLDNFRAIATGSDATIRVTYFG